MNQMNPEVEQQVTAFFHDFAMRMIIQEHADPNNINAVKMAMMVHCEEIYPAFTLTPVFRENNGKAHYDDMVEAYQRCFTMLLQGQLP